MLARYLPRPLDFFPRTRRGHGTTHENDRYDKTRLVRKACPCVNPACERLRLKGGEQHDDQEMNVLDWKAEHGFHKRTPIELCR